MNYKHITLNPAEYGKLSYKKRWAIEIVDELASTSSKNEKVEILKKAIAENPGFVKGIYLCYSPRIKMYIKKIPDYKPAKASAYDCVRILNDLSLFYERRVTGNAAIQKLQDILEIADPRDAEFIERIMERDLGCGCSAGSINKAYNALHGKDLIEEFPVMLCSSFDSEKLENFDFPAIAQTKMDGMRIHAVYEKNDVKYYTRNGNSFEDSPEALTDYIVRFVFPWVGSPPGFVLDGEMLVLNSDGTHATRKEGNGVLTRLIRGTSTKEDRNRVQFVVWDIIPIADFWNGLWNVEYKQRFETLSKIIRKAHSVHGGGLLVPLVKIVDTSYVNNKFEALRLFNDELASGNEGIILKSVHGIWKNTRPKWQLKMKAELEMDAVVVDVQEGTGKFEGMLGALICEAETPEGQKIRFNVGSGFNDADRTELWQERPIGKIVNVKYNEIIKSKGSDDLSLFLPIFCEVRNDINPL